MKEKKYNLIQSFCHITYCWILEKKFVRQKKNILTLVLSEKKILIETKNHNPPFKLNGRSLSSLGILNVENRVKQLYPNHADKIFSNTCPSYLKNNFIKINEHHKHNTKSSF